MQNYYTPKSKHLTLTERRMIERWLQEGLSNREIARRLAKAPQTIHNEVKRGQVRQQAVSYTHLDVYKRQHHDGQNRKHDKLYHLIVVFPKSRYLYR